MTAPQGRPAAGDGLDDMLWNGRPLRGSCGYCGIAVDSTDLNHRVTSIVRGGRGVECVLRGDIHPSEGGLLRARSGGEALTAGDGLDRVAMRRRANWAVARFGPQCAPMADDVRALLDALEAAEAEVARLRAALATAVPAGTAPRVHPHTGLPFYERGESDLFGAPLRTEGGAS